MRLYRGKIFARCVYKNTNARDDTTMRFFFGLVRLVLCKIFARWVHKNTNARDDTTMRCFVFGWKRRLDVQMINRDSVISGTGWMRLYRGKIFARYVYKNTNAGGDTTMRCFVFGWMRLYRGKIFAR
jgi:hypothetical protein